MDAEAHARDRAGKDVEELRALYADEAQRFERMEPLARLLLGRYRRRLFGRAEGRVLDVACGTGANVPYLPADVELVGVDLSPAMLARARAADSGRDAVFVEADAARLPFSDDGFDTVVSSLATCMFPDPVAALREMDRVCRPDGRVLLLEHGRSSVGPLARLQDWWAPRHFEKTGCRWNQQPSELVVEAGLDPVSVRRWLLGVVTTVVARPTTPG